MVDNSELEYLVTFATEVTTGVTVASWKTIRNISHINDDLRMLIYPGELMNINGKFFKKRYLFKTSTTTEETMMTLFNELVIGCDNYNKRASLGGSSTYPAVMCNINLAYAGRDFIEVTKRINKDLWVDVEWASA